MFNLIAFIRLGSSLRIHGVLRPLLQVFNCHGVLCKSNANSTFQRNLSFDTFILFSTVTYSGRPVAQLAFHFMCTNRLMVQVSAV